ncbi:6-phosphogluconolactonase, cycloisomerase 2 family [Catalinimonas alkaloidigena]|uniref:6-phosphogluconolactonase, cycloisomerase 2 family n=1 Tax=Catalinimonas alkaloidigena TaxID=1075417 RepID=A0A1G9SGN5_9BACT|nr:beta-propeller fold lactonase family protein [Catalinimonas alkaloidigena]SDM34656.1 6-phosphogluconolactonase, cycloisomerase 2 family [Catalinimonas alkaloidigena]
MKNVFNLPLLLVLMLGLFSSCEYFEDFTPPPGHGQGPAANVVFVSTNQPSGNAIMVYKREKDGTLMPHGSYPTGGKGIDGGLGSQGALVMHDGRLFVVNAGSNEVSVFEIDGYELTLVERVASGGMMPTSLTVHNDLLYVMNAGGEGNLTGFRVRDDGTLKFIPSSTRYFSNDGTGPAPAPAQIEFSPNGRTLVATERATNYLLTFSVLPLGTLGNRQISMSSGQTPFGFAFNTDDQLVVSEAFGGAENASALSSYRIKPNGTLATLSGSVGTDQTAACWVAITDDHRYAYTTNTGSGNLTGYKIASTGELGRLSASGNDGDTGLDSRPIDLALSRSSKFLYALNAEGSISGFAVQMDGSLASLGKIMDLDPTPAGIVAR